MAKRADGRHDITTDPDPTKNVKDLVVAEKTRNDDLRIAESRRVDELAAAECRLTEHGLASLRREAELRAQYEAQLRDAESGRIDAIRAVDVNAVSVASERAAAAANVLANQVSASAEALRALVASTAATIAQQLAALTSQLTDRLSLLEKSSYEGAGKSTRDDPQMALLLSEVKALTASLSKSEGGAAISTPLMIGISVAIVGGLGGALFGLVEAVLHASGH